MCGIAGLILKSPDGGAIASHLKVFSKSIQHRGPDGEGYILVNKQRVEPFFNDFPTHSTRNLNYLPKHQLPENDASSLLGFVHRRLSIIDLSESGHQPMCDTAGKIWITYNGELYNYPELREELIKQGYTFVSESDTEVIIQAYRYWGDQCVEHFNGMWAFCIYDSENRRCFASRDRLGVKPFYYVDKTGLFAFASEQKALVNAGIAAAHVSDKALHNYLVNVQLENEVQNFFADIKELWPGTNLVYNLDSHDHKIHSYYHLKDHLSTENSALSDEALIGKIATTFKQAVRLRLRSDVEVGTCLSGGLDSSAIAMSISELRSQPFHCFTSVFSNSSLNEEHFADIVAKKAGALHHKVEPTFAGLVQELDELIYSQDVPIWDTSTYAQYKVMELAKQNNIKVVLDGQGADELFAGYHHHYLATWNHYFSKGHISSAIRNINAASDSIHNPFLFFIKERLKQSYNFQYTQLNQLLKKEFLNAYAVAKPNRYFNDLNKQLLNDIYQTRLKSFLKCEDRCGMWHSVESRVPFSDDIHLINLMFSFDGNRKIQKGTSKYLLREALRTILPEEIYLRRDKKGFETPVHDWLKRLRPQMVKEILDSNLEMIDPVQLQKTTGNSLYQNKLIFRLFVYSRWAKRFKA